MLNYYRFFIRFNLNHLLIATVFPRFSVFYSGSSAVWPVVCFKFAVIWPLITGFYIKNENTTNKCRQNKNMTKKCKLYIL